MFWRISLIVFLAISIASCQNASVEWLNSSLIEANQLQGLIDSNTPVSIIDVRTNSEFKQGHLVGAVNINRADIEPLDTLYAGIALNAKKLAQLLGERGVAGENLIVLYDNKGGVEAARLWWLLKVYGNSNTAILNGGINSWTYDLSTEFDIKAPQKFVFNGIAQPDLGMTYSLFEESRINSRVKIIDCRSKDEFLGNELKGGAAMAGHIPGAIHYDYINNIDLESTKMMKFKSVDDLRKQYSEIVQPKDTIILYCHSGVRSAHTLFVLTELLDYKHVANYDGSWVEWSFFNQSLNDSLITQN